MEWHKGYGTDGREHPHFVMETGDGGFIMTGEATFGRPGYSHLLCYSRGIRDVIAKGSGADVLPTAGEMTWSRAMGVEVCDFACRYVQSRTTSHTIVDPFCGRGTVLAVANRRGLDAVGVEIGKRRAHRARGLQIRED